MTASSSSSSKQPPITLSSGGSLPGLVRLPNIACRHGDSSPRPLSFPHSPITPHHPHYRCPYLPYPTMKAAVLSVVSLVSLASLAAATPLAALAPIHTPNNVFEADGQFSAQSQDSHLIKDRYIVVLKEEAPALPFHLRHLSDFLAGQNHQKRSLGGFLEGVAHHFDIGDLKGYAGTFSPHTLDWIRRNPAVSFVERDSVVKAMDLEKGAPWGLARLSHRERLGIGNFGKYEYMHKGGSGVDVYVIDTGINTQHIEFEGRAKWGKTMPLNDVDEDGNGHGSHVAGTIASATYGVAKDANLIAVKVLGSGGSGSMSDVVGGVAWATAQAASKMQTETARNGTHKGSVANMSLGGGKSAALDLAVNNAVKKGLNFAVAAGNDNRDACSYSPAGAEQAITVGASTVGDERAYFSNFGKCVDIFAPGLNILSTWNSGNTSTNKISGTSMAAPHIAGLTAYYLSLYPLGGFSPSEEDYKMAGVPLPAESAQSEDSDRSLFSKGRQVIFGGLFGQQKQPSALKVLDPRVLKQTMLRLSTKNILSQIPADGTPNYLAFNNYTSPSSKAEDEAVVEEMFHALPIFEESEAVVEDAFEQLEEMIERVIADDLKWLTE
ncbi:MAG: serine protease [Cyphobasidiales sp. Tagirdzhanova-0007]|nr:MAG: serine protease [Cyphobasidiales sp. Tagirdzhanova-0007]